MIKRIDAFLNGFTTYKVMLYGLLTLLAIAEILSLTGAVSVSSAGIVLTLVVAGVACYLSNELLARLLKATTNSESWLITAAILTCILPPSHTVTHLLYVVLASIIAMASKYVLVHRGTHIFNPAAFGAFVLSITGLLAATWWVATPWLTPFTVLLGLVVLRKIRHFQLFLAFAIPAVLILVLTASIIHGTDVGSVLRSAALSWPIIFFGTIMLTEPVTLPATAYYQILLAIITGLLFTSQLHSGRLVTTPEAVLLVGNLLAFLAEPRFGAVLKFKKINKLSPTLFEAVFTKPAGSHFTAGQYMELTLAHKGADIRGNRRTFSIVSAPTEPELKIAFRQYERGSSFKKALLAMQPGDNLHVSNVAGNFTLPASEQPLLFVAGGIGITPFHSMITSLAAKRDVNLLYLSNNPEDFIYKQEFEKAASHGVKTRYIEGRLDPKQLQQLIPDLSKRLVYLSGPDAMVTGYKHMLTGLGVKNRAIKTDHFTGY